MKKEAIFKKGIKELIEKSSLEDISVVSLCKYVGSNRQTFYYHFRDIYDLLAATMLREQIAFTKSEINFDNIYEAINRYINQNLHFLQEVKKSYAGDLIDNFFSSFIYEKLQQHFRLNVQTNVSKTFILALERCLSNVLALEFSYYVSSSKKEGATKFKKRLKSIWNYFMNKHIEEAKIDHL